MAIKKIKTKDFDVEIGLPDGQKWSKEKLSGIKQFVQEQAFKRTPERKLNNEMLAVRYQMEEYLEERNPDIQYSIEKFLKDYLHVLNIPFKHFALAIDSSDGNLKKYVSGERKFNTDLAMKFGHFFHTPADLWLQIFIKNELMNLNKEKREARKYQKYDYKKLTVGS